MLRDHLNELHVIEKIDCAANLASWQLQNNVLAACKMVVTAFLRAANELFFKEIFPMKPPNIQCVSISQLSSYVREGSFHGQTRPTPIITLHRMGKNQL